MSLQITVRPAASGDLEAVNRVASETWRATYAGTIADRDIVEFVNTNYNLDRLRLMVERLGDGFLLAVADDEPVGYATISRNRDGDAELWAIYVLPERQGAGAGRLLWDAAVIKAKTLDTGRMVLSVVEQNISARAFYERRGAVQIATLQDSIGGSPVTLVRYALLLG